MTWRVKICAVFAEKSESVGAGEIYKVEWSDEASNFGVNFRARFLQVSTWKRVGFCRERPKVSPTDNTILFIRVRGFHSYIFPASLAAQSTAKILFWQWMAGGSANIYVGLSMCRWYAPLKVAPPHAHYQAQTRHKRMPFTWLPHTLVPGLKCKWVWSWVAKEDTSHAVSFFANLLSGFKIKLVGRV